jgi:hypothetical protein
VAGLSRVDVLNFDDTIDAGNVPLKPRPRLRRRHPHVYIQMPQVMRVVTRS